MSQHRVLWQDQLARGAVEMGLKLSGLQFGRLLDYLALLLKWNKAFNLTAVRDPSAMVPRHVLDSLSIAPWVEGICRLDGVAMRLLDVGTGAGLPGIPLAILDPDLQCTLLDSNGKKTRFVKQVILELKLDNVTIVQSRLQDYVVEEPFDLITARAFSSLGELVNLTDRLLARGGVLLAMKGTVPVAEIASLKANGGSLEVHGLQIPQLDGERNLIRLIK